MAAKKAKSGGSSVYDGLKRELRGSRSGGNSEFWRFKDDGDETMRFLTFEDEGGNTQFCVRQAKHWNCGTKAPINCPDEEGECPICGMEADLEEAGIWSGNGMNGVKPNLQLLCHAVIREADKGKDKQVVAQVPLSVGKGISKYIDPDSKVFIPNFFDLKKGYDVIVTREQKGKGPVKYTVEAARTPSAVVSTSECFDLNRLVKQEPEESMNAAVDYLTALMKGGKKKPGRGK